MGETKEGPLSLEEKYRRWLRSMQCHIDSELADGERAAEWTKARLPRLEEDHKRLYLKSVDERVAPGDAKRRIRPDYKMPNVAKLQMLKYFVVDSMLREPVTIAAQEPLEVQGEVRLEIREDGDQKLKVPSRARSNKRSLVAIGATVSTGILLLVSGFSVPGSSMSLSEYFQIACWQTAVVVFYAASLVIRDHLRDFGSLSLPFRRTPPVVKTLLRSALSKCDGN